MPTTDVIHLEDLDAHVAETLRKVNDGVAAARASGIQAELPKEVTFDMVVITKNGWQALSAATIDTNESEELSKDTDTTKVTEKQGGGDHEVTKGTSSESATSDGTRTQQGENHHTQNVDEITDTYEA